MARDISKRLAELHTRRLGMDSLARLNEASAASVLQKSLTGEPWQKRSQAKPYTRYALGAMQAVDADYTQKSVDTATRVGNQLVKALTPMGFAVEFRLQGSVPLNVHIRGVSDVDLLNLETSQFSYDAGVKSQAGWYSTPASKTSLQLLTDLRGACERALTAAFPAVTVDKSGGKAIALSGGSLERPVDVVPSIWHNTAGYQTSGVEYDRGVKILDKKIPTTIINLPFLHIKRVTDRCNTTSGGLRKAIRLAKNVKADAEKEGTSIALPSFDIAAAMYHANISELSLGQFYELAILAETQRHLDAMATDHNYARSLMTPDGSRFIFDTPAKLAALNTLSVEVDDLAREVAREQNTLLALDAMPSLASSRSAIARLMVP